MLYVLGLRVSRLSHKNLKKISLALISLEIFSIDFQSQTFVQYAETVERKKSLQTDIPRHLKDGVRSDNYSALSFWVLILSKG